jgi:hypothetical protein
MTTKHTSRFCFQFFAVGFFALLFLGCVGCQTVQPQKEQSTTQSDPETTAAYVLWWATYYAGPFLAH